MDLIMTSRMKFNHCPYSFPQTLAGRTLVSMVFLVALQQLVRLARSSYKGVANGLTKNWGLVKIMSAEL